MARREKLYEGKAKIIYQGEDENHIIVYYKDDATAFNNQKKGTVIGKGVLNNRISEYLMVRLHEIGIPTHFVKRINMREQQVKKLDIIPIEVIVRNVVAGSLAKRLGLIEGTKLNRSIVEYCYKDDALGDPLVADEHIVALGWASPQDLDDMMALTLRINDFLCGIFACAGMKLIDFKLEFGRMADENEEVRIILGDELSPDNMRLWDRDTGDKMDKDRFRRDLGGVEEAYEEVARRLGLMSHDQTEEA
ncbi:MAG: phosphoribosylaminoimidazolesuccinocarboxamide synthase [Alphaproteobacteria bacterium]